MTNNYKATINSESLPHVSGPGQGLYHETGLTFNSAEDAERAAKVANIAYDEGFRRAQWEMRQAMGVRP